jgi:hypothetical protein
MSAKSTSAIDSTHCINKAFLCPGRNYVYQISAEVVKNLDG